MGQLDRSRVGASCLLASLAACAPPPLSPMDAGTDASSVDAPSPVDAARAREDAYEMPIDAGSIPFALGLSQFTNGSTPDDGQMLGASWLRPTLQWRFVEASVEVEGLTLEDVQSDEAIAAWSENADFTSTDAIMIDCFESGASLVVGVGTGWRRAMPLVGADPASPTSLGEEEYLARMYRLVRATVERYDGDGLRDLAGSPRVEVWQIENELNEALYTAIGGERWPSGLDSLSSPWRSFAFLTRLLETLALAVRDADPTARVLTNMHTSVHPDLDRTFGVRTWGDALMAWRGTLDWVGLDVYPNISLATPIAADVVGSTVAAAIPIANGRPVLVIETGYPTAPVELGYGEEGQQTYLRASFDAARAAGAAGFFWYGTRTREPDLPVFSAEDVALHAEIGRALNEGDASTLLRLMSSTEEERFAAIIGAVQGYWGLFRADGTPKLAAGTFSELAASLP